MAARRMIYTPHADDRKLWPIGLSPKHAKMATEIIDHGGSSDRAD